MTLLQRLRAKQKSGRRGQALRLEKRCGYVGAAHERAIQVANNTGLADLPDGVAIAVEELSAAEPVPESVKPDASV